MCPASHNMDVPNVTRAEYQLLDINMDDGTISLLTDAGDTKDDLNLPAGSKFKISSDNVLIFQTVFIQMF
jgi:hypothetical protein